MVSKEDKRMSEVLKREWLKRGIGGNYSAVKLVPISSSKKLTNKLFDDAKYTGIGGKYPTAVLDHRKMKILYTHL